MRVIEIIARSLRIAAAIALAAMMAVTIVDVTMRNTINELVLGGVELVELTLVLTVFLALPETFLRNEHVTIDAIDLLVSPRVVKILRCIGAFLTLLLLVLLAWRMVLPAIDTVTMGDLTSDLGIPLIWYWLPLLIGGIASVATAAAMAVRELGAGAEPETTYVD